MLGEHLGYVADQRRLDRYRAAIAEVLRPGDTVADVGCGTGVLGLLCLQAGASRVCAIDASGIVEVARQTFARAGYSDRATLIRGVSERTELPERVDLAVCDHVGFFGFDYGIVHTLQDARRRFLVPGGRLIPAGFRLFVAAVESEACRARAEAWVAANVPAEFHWLRRATVNARHAADLPREALLSAPAALGGFDLRLDHPDFFSWQAELSVLRDGVVHGVGGWFECALSATVRMTNSPLSDDAIERSQAFLPIDAPVAVKAGERIDVRVMARPADNLLAWIVAFPASGRRYSQSTWNGLVLAPEDLARVRPDRVPRPSHEGRARGIVIDYCDGTRTAREIADCVLRDHPTLFPSASEVSRFVAQVLARDTEP